MNTAHRHRSNPHNFTQLFANHNDYKNHLNNLFNIKGQVDQKQPQCQNLTHLRPKTYKDDLFKQREVQKENDHLVIKILKLRNAKSPFEMLDKKT